MSRTVPVAAMQSPGNLIAAALWNAGVVALNSFLTAVPLATLSQSTVTSLANNSWTSIGFDLTTYDSDGGHSNTTNNSRYVVQVPGKILIVGGVSSVANATGQRGARAAKNGAAIPDSAQFLSTTAAFTPSLGSLPVVVSCAVGDYLEIQGFQNSGGAINTQNGTDGTGCGASLFWVST